MMKAIKGTLMVCLVFFFGLIGLVFPPDGEAASKRLLAMGTTQAASSHYAYFVAVAKVINAKMPDTNVSVVETGASVDNINRIRKGELDFGMTTIHLQYQAYHGLGPWQGKPIKDQYVLWVYQPAPQNFVVREDSGVKTVYDLAGKPFNPGMRGSATEKTAESIMDALAIAPKWYRGGTEDAVAAIKDKRAVGYVKSGAGIAALDASTLDIATFASIRLLGFTPEEIKKVQAKYPFLSPITIPKGIYKETPSYQTFAMLIGAVAKKDLPEEFVYRLVKAVWEGFEEQVAAFPSVKGINLPKLTLDTCTVPLHPGAVKYYRELGLKVPDQLIPKD